MNENQNRVFVDPLLMTAMQFAGRDFASRDYIWWKAYLLLLKSDNQLLDWHHCCEWKAAFSRPLSSAVFYRAFFIQRHFRLVSSCIFLSNGIKSNISRYQCKNRTVIMLAGGVSLKIYTDI